MSGYYYLKQRFDKAREQIEQLRNENRKLTAIIKGITSKLDTSEVETVSALNYAVFKTSAPYDIKKKVEVVTSQTKKKETIKTIKRSTCVINPKNVLTFVIDEMNNYVYYLIEIYPVTSVELDKETIEEIMTPSIQVDANTINFDWEHITGDQTIEDDYTSISLVGNWIVYFDK